MADMTDDQVKALLDHYDLPTDCDCDGDDCVKCSHYPTFQERASKQLKDVAPDLARALLDARAELARVRADSAAAQALRADARREGGSPLTYETPAQHEERTCTCGAGHGSLEGHMDWCDFTAYQSLNALAEVQARDDASTPPDTTWHERRPHHRRER